MQDINLAPIAEKVYAGTRLSEDDALMLFESSDLLSVGKLADYANQRLNGDRVFYNINRHINPTNICAMSCKFCAFSRKPGEEGAYAFDMAQILEKAGEAVAQGATEIHMVGGLHPRWPFKTYLDKIAAIHQAHPHVHIKAFTVVELDWIARRERRTIAEVLKDLREAGLGSLPGGGAEIFHPEIREKICDTKVTADQWIATHRLAHNSGMRSNCTMLYGHVESYFHRVDHMRRLRELQDETKGFNVFIPLAFQPFENEMGVDRYTFGFDDLKTLAVARLYLDNFQNIKAYWIMLGQDTAQLGLNFGANDFDGTVTEENISRMAGGRAGMAMSRNDLETLIRRCGRTPVERDTLYRPIHASSIESQKQSASVHTGSHLNTSEATLENLSQLATQSSFFELGEAARAITKRDHQLRPTLSPAYILKLSDLKTSEDGFQLSGSFVPHVANADLLPSTIVLDCEGLDTANVNARIVEGVFAVLSTCKQKFPDATLALAGLRAFWALARICGSSLTEMAARLRHAGVSHIESSPGERESDMTPAEISNLHEACHAADLRTIGKAELVVGPFNSGAPHWDAFIRRLLTLRDLSRKTQGLHSVQVTSTPGGKITATEYLRGVALARIIMPKECAISTPLLAIPTHGAGSHIGIDGTQHPAEKTASVALAFGSSDLGHIPMDQISIMRITEDIAASGLTPEFRNSGLGGKTIPPFYALHISKLQHSPGGRALTH